MSDWYSTLPEHNKLTDETMRKLLGDAQNGDEQAREQLIEGNLRLVASVSARFINRGLEKDDLFQIGCVGLVKAIDGFDLSYNVKFSTYAVPKIIGEIKRYIRESSPLHVSRSLRQLASEGIAVKDELNDQLGRPPLIKEIAEKLDVSKEELVAAFEAVSPVLSLQQVVHEKDGSPISLEEQLAVSDEDTNLFLKDSFAKLNNDERRLMLLRYFAEKSQSEVAADLGISQAQVSRIEKRILHELRRQLQTKG